MDAIASQITSLTIVYLTVYSGADQRKHQRSASLAFVRGIHRRPVNSPHKWPVTRKMFALMTSSCPNVSSAERRRRIAHTDLRLRFTPRILAASSKRNFYVETTFRRKSDVLITKSVFMILCWLLMMITCLFVLSSTIELHLFSQKCRKMRFIF